MSNGAAEFSELMTRVRAGSEEAAWELIAQYGDLVFRVVRNRLPQNLRRAFDSEDFVQVAWASVFRHRSRLDRFDTAGDFIAFVATVAANKVRMEVRRRCQLQKHNVNRERPLDSAAQCDDQAPTPCEVAVAREQWERLLEKQPDHYQEIVQLRYLGYTSREIAGKVGLDDGTVRRILRNILKNTVS